MTFCMPTANIPKTKDKFKVRREKKNLFSMAGGKKVWSPLVYSIVFKFNARKQSDFTFFPV